MTLTLDLQNPIMSSVGASEYSLQVSKWLFKPFMRYHGNKICPDKSTNRQMNKWTDKCSRRTDRKHKGFADTVVWQRK